MSNVLDLGNGHRLLFFEDGEGNRIGAIHEHPWPADQPNPGEFDACRGTLFFDAPATKLLFAREGRERPMWQIVQEEPLTLAPSIRCMGGVGMRCLVHGYIRDGKWVDA